MYPKVQKRIPPHPAATDQALVPPSGYVDGSAFSEAKGVPSWMESPRRLSGSFCISTEDIWYYGSDEKILQSALARRDLVPRSQALIVKGREYVSRARLGR